MLWGIVLGSLFSGNKALSDYVFLFILMFLSVTGLQEFYGMVAKLGHACYAKAGIFGGMLLLVATFCYISGQFGTAAPPSRVNDFETSFFILFVLGLCIRQFVSRHTTTGIVAISTTLFGLMYVPLAVELHPENQFLRRGCGWTFLHVLYFIVVTKLSDCGAYAVGSLIGKHKMIPRISPGKTWEGFYGAVVVSTAASVIFSLKWQGAHLFGMTLTHSIILGVIFEHRRRDRGFD